MCLHTDQMFQKTCFLIFMVEDSSVLKMDVQVHMMIWYVSTKLHAVTSQKTKHNIHYIDNLTPRVLIHIFQDCLSGQLCQSWRLLFWVWHSSQLCSQRSIFLEFTTSLLLIIAVVMAITINMFVITLEKSCFTLSITPCAFMSLGYITYKKLMHWT